jgi:hypothetical protein
MAPGGRNWQLIYPNYFLTLKEVSQEIPIFQQKRQIWAKVASICASF